MSKDIELGVEPIIITQNKPLRQRIQGVDVYVDYEMAQRVRSYRNDGVKVISGWWPDGVQFQPPIFIKAVDVTEYIEHGQGD